MENPTILHISTLTGEWCDKDIVLLHGCFQLLVDCIEKEKLLTGHTDWDSDDEFKSAKIEIQALYDWWAKRLADEEVLDELSESQYEKENEMLIRLIKIRKYLWT